MPNTLAHYGVQGPLTRLTGVVVDVKWILLGCVLPDVPWILRRLVLLLPAGAVDPIGLRLYAIVQASLLFCLGLSAALALFSARPGPVFAVLALGSVLHLLLDAAQTKWGSGVHLFAPLSWETLNVGWFWPESPITVALTAGAVGYLAWEWFRRPGFRVSVEPSGAAIWAAGGLVVLYLASPPVFFDDALASGSHSLDVLAEPEGRTGRKVALDRVRYDPGGDDEEDPGTVSATGGDLRAVGDLPAGAATVSLRGVFVDRRTVRVTDHHVHRPVPRDLASYVGLGLLAVFWLRDLTTGTREGEDPWSG